MMGYNRTWCFSCVTDLEPDGEALQCAYCSNWQHLKCAKGVSQSFFTKFYLAVMNREKPAYWECQDCAEHQSVLAPLKVPLLVPSKVRRDSNIQDEINFGFGVPLTAEVLIKPWTVIEDVHSVFPTAYCLYREQSGAEKVVRDIHGNVFRTTWLYVDDTESYQCCHFGCQFQVLVSEKRGVFLTSKENDIHRHSIKPLEFWRDSKDSDVKQLVTVKTAIPTKLSQQPLSAKLKNPSQPVPTAKTAKPTKPSQPVPTAKTAKPTQPSQPVPTAKTAKPTKPSQPVFTAKTAKPTKPSQPVFTPKTAKPTKPSQPVPTAKTAKPTQPSQPVPTAKTAKPTKPSQPVPTAKTAKPTKPSQPVFTAKTAKPTKPSQPVPTATTTKPTQPGLYRTTKRPLEDCSNSSDDSIPAKKIKQEHHVEPETITCSLSKVKVTGETTKYILTDTRGYTYQIKYKRQGRYFGTCTDRKSGCSANVIQTQKNQFRRNAASHNHWPQQSQTSTGNAPNSEAPGDQSQTSQSKTTSKSAANKSQTSRTKGSTTVPAASQSDEGHMQKQIPNDQTPAQEDTGDKLPPGENLTSTKKSKPAKEVKATAPAKTKQEAPSSTLQFYSSPANPLICQRCSLEATFQEVSTCPRYGRKEQSYLLDPEYYMYKTKIGDEVTRTTTWKCTHVGDDGTKCPGKVQYDYLRDFNQDDNYSYDWTLDHSDHSVVRTQPHNHGPDKATAVDLLIKAHIHQLIFGHEELFTTAADIITNAYDWLHDHESLVALPLNSRRYKRYIYSKKDEFRSNFGFYHYHYRFKNQWTDSEEEDKEEESSDDELTDEEAVEAKKEYQSGLLRHR